MPKKRKKKKTQLKSYIILWTSECMFFLFGNWSSPCHLHSLILFFVYLFPCLPYRFSTYSYHLSSWRSLRNSESRFSSVCSGFALMTNPFFFSINLFFFKFNHMEKGKLQIFELKKKHLTSVSGIFFVMLNIYFSQW